MLQGLAKLLRYDVWANGETLASMTATGQPPGGTLRLLAHIIGAELLWINRLRGEAASIAVWPDLNTEQCAAYLAELPVMWDDYLAGLTPDNLHHAVVYTNSQGERWKSSVEDILFHVVAHSAYHRGQIAAETRRAGTEPAYTDYIHATRSGAVE